MAASSNKYVLREFLVSDYAQFINWFEEAPKLEDLPPIGLVSGEMKAVGFLYRTDSTFCVLAFWHSNPDNSNIESYRGLREVIMGLCDIAKNIGKKNVFIATTNRGMIKLLKGLGFYNADGHLILRVSDD